jgi:beclin 1
VSLSFHRPHTKELHILFLLKLSNHRYRLVPMASFSRIERIGGDKAVMELFVVVFLHPSLTEPCSLSFPRHRYGSGDIAFGRLFQNRRFDHAMVAFLDCLRQLMDHANQRAGGPGVLRLPHQYVPNHITAAAIKILTVVDCLNRVHKDKIGDVSIKLQFGSDETWTRALRHVLLNLKILLASATE